MKKLFLLSLFSAILCTISFMAEAQTRYLNRNITEGIVREKTTTDSTGYSTVDSLVVGANEVGFVTVHLVGYNDSASVGVTGVKHVRFKKIAGTLTLGTVGDLQTTVADSELSPATWRIIAVNNNVYVQVKGAPAITIYWRSVLKSKSIRKL